MTKFRQHNPKISIEILYIPRENESRCLIDLQYTLIKAKNKINEIFQHKK